MEHSLRSEGDLLRMSAEMYLENKFSGNDRQQLEGDMLKLLQELAVYQVELEMQNEELKEARAAAQDVTDKYTELYDFAPLSYFTLNRQGKILKTNICGFQMLSIDGSIINANWFGYFVSVETKSIFNNFLKQLFDNKIKESCEVSLTIKTHFPVDVHLTGIISGNGEHCLVIASDITQQKQSEIRYRRLFESAKDGILILDAATGMINDVNPFLIDLLGYSKESFVNKEIWKIGSFKNVVANKDKLFELKRKRYVRLDNLPLETSTGRKINVEFVSNVYFESNKELIQCNIRDITVRLHKEEALKKTYN